MLNLLGSHDTVRPMTIALCWRDRDARHALDSLKLMATMQFTFLGAPCVYYGDEIGLQGEKDPDCRRCFPWGWEQQDQDGDQKSELLAYYKKLDRVRKANPALRSRAFYPLEAELHQQLYVFERCCPGNRCIVALNSSGRDRLFSLPRDFSATELLTSQPIRGGRVTVPARQAIVVRLEAPVVEQRPEPCRPQPDPVGRKTSCGLPTASFMDHTNVGNETQETETELPAMPNKVRHRPSGCRGPLDDLLSKVRASASPARIRTSRQIQTYRRSNRGLIVACNRSWARIP